MGTNALKTGDVFQVTCAEDKPYLVGALGIVRSVESGGLEGYLHHIGPHYPRGRGLVAWFAIEAVERIGRAVLVPETPTTDSFG